MKINFIYSILKAVYKDVGNIVSRYKCRFRVGQEHVMMVMFHTTWAQGPPLHPYALNTWDHADLTLHQWGHAVYQEVELFNQFTVAYSLVVGRTRSILSSVTSTTD